MTTASSIDLDLKTAAIFIKTVLLFITCSLNILSTHLVLLVFMHEHVKHKLWS